MLGVEEILTIISLLDQISPKDQGSRNQVNELKKYIADHLEDPDYVEVEDDELTSSEEEDPGEEEEHIIDKTDPNFICIK
jgi:hypothetical protein